jgi:hypothetical protein
MARIWIYEGRNSAARAFWNYEDAREAQDRENGGSLEDLIDSAAWVGAPLEYGGSKEEGYFYIDDGGSIHLVEVE